jgi:hypothetical protein
MAAVREHGVRLIEEAKLGASATAIGMRPRSPAPRQSAPQYSPPRSLICNAEG